MSFPYNIFSGLVGAIIAALVAIYIHFRSQPPKQGMAYKVLRDLRKRLEPQKGEYCRTKSADQNYEIAQDLFRLVEGKIIATVFHENPKAYGDNDLVRLFYCKDFTRITCEEICDSESQKIARRNLLRLHRGANFVIIPRDELYVRVDGIFCEFRDNTYLCFLAFRDPEDSNRNKGIVFREDIAEDFYNYYKSLSQKYGSDN